jgi:hypothetical protein
MIPTSPQKGQSLHLIKGIEIAGYLMSFCFMFFACSVKSTPNGTNNPPANHLDSILTPISEIEAAFANQDSGISVIVKGSITRILTDDTAGEAHQRFIIALSNSQTLLIEHNIDISPRVQGITVGSLVYVHGDYIWNSQGGLVHWTHHDPDGVHEDGWIVFEDVKYE